MQHFIELYMKIVVIIRIANGCDSSDVSAHGNHMAYRIGEQVFTLSALQDLYNEKIEHAKAII